MYVPCIYVYIQCIYMYIHCTSVPRIVCIYHYCGCHCILACSTLYRLWHRYIKCYCGGIYHCVHTGIYLLYTPSEWLLRQLIKTCTYIAYTCTYSVYTCTYTVHGYHVLYAYIPLLCLPLHACIYNAIMQESTIVYIQGYTSYIPLRMVVKTTD